MKVACYLAFLPLFSVAKGDPRGVVKTQHNDEVGRVFITDVQRRAEEEIGTGKKNKKGKKMKKTKKGQTNDEHPECPHRDPIDAESVRAELKKFVDSLEDGLELNRGYHPNVADQIPDWHTCTIVQQCLDPDFILSVGMMSSRSRGYVYKVMSKAMSQESFNMLQLQQHSNMLLGEMQDWATTCPGECRELHDPNGLLEPIVGSSLADQSDPVPFLNYADCGNLLHESGKKLFWYCNDEPRMVHEANIDVSTGKYMLGDIWNEPHIHGRNLVYDFFSAYGDMEENGGAFGLRFSGHHFDLNYHWNDAGELVNDNMPVFLGHNPLMVPEVTPPLSRTHDEKADNDHSYYPLMWANMAGITQFSESVDLLLEVSNFLLPNAPGSFVPLTNWISTGYAGSLTLANGKSMSDFDSFDLSTATEDVFQIMWNLVDYTLKFTHGHTSTERQRAIFRAEGKAIWTTSNPPAENLPLTEDDLRSNMNFINLRIETDDYLYFVMVNQLYSVISENEPTNHFHSLYVAKNLMNNDHACIESSTKVKGALCESSKRTKFTDPSESEMISGPFKYESSMWEERNLKGKSTLNLDVIDETLKSMSEDLCDMGFTATVFDENATQVYQNTVGSIYTPIDETGYAQIDGFGPETEGWTGDTTMTVFSNAKITVAINFLASVVQEDLGSLDEPLYLTFPEFLTEASLAGRITPRMILSHTSGTALYNRNAPTTDPYYVCKYSDKTRAECLSTYVLNDSTMYAEPGSTHYYNNEGFDVLAELIVRKTGLDNYGEIFRQFVTEPLGMDSTSYDCPVLKSTSEKPHMAWGLCSTAHDMAKMVQMLANKGMTQDGKQILTPFHVQQIFSHGGGVAVNDGPYIFGGLQPAQLVSRCYARLFTPEELGVDSPYLLKSTGTSFPLNSIEGYGLGTMFVMGNRGELFAHAGSTGGFWVVAPGRFSAYIGFMTFGEGRDMVRYAYHLMGDLLNALEESSTFKVSKTKVLEDNMEEPELCGGHDMYFDWWSKIGITSIKEIVGLPECSDGRRRTQTTRIHPDAEFIKEMWSQNRSPVKL